MSDWIASSSPRGRSNVPQREGPLSNRNGPPNGRLWQRPTHRPGRNQTSVCSVISSASSPSIPRYRTVLSSLLTTVNRVDYLPRGTMSSVD